MMCDGDDGLDMVSLRGEEGAGTGKGPPGSGGPSGKAAKGKKGKGGKGKGGKGGKGGKDCSVCADCAGCWDTDKCKCIDEDLIGDADQCANVYTWYHFAPAGFWRRREDHEHRHREQRRKRPFQCAPPASPPPPKVSTTPPSRAGLFGYDQDHGERPGQSDDLRARPASFAPARTKAKELETQALVENNPITFKCYGASVTAKPFTAAPCLGK